MAKLSVVVVLLAMLLVSIYSVVVLAEEEPTVGQRLDSAVTGVTNAFNEHGGPDAVHAVSSTVKTVYGWLGEKAKEWGIHF
ncbi:unnamed protein product [Cochlearia groenlandica]